MTTIEAGAVDAPKSLRGRGTGAGRQCTVCISPKRAEIEAAIVAGGRPRELASRFDINRQAIVRHRDNHVPSPAMAAGARAVLDAETEHGAGLMDRARSLLREAEELLSKAKQDGDIVNALRGVAVANQVLVTMSKLAGAIDDSTTVNVTLAPVLVSLQSAIMTALAPFPDARRAVVMALGALTDRQPLQIEGHAG